MNVGQLKILQEIITLTVFVPFAVWYIRRKRSRWTICGRRSVCWARCSFSFAASYSDPDGRAG